MLKIDGKYLSNIIMTDVELRVLRLYQIVKKYPKLAIVQVGNHGPSDTFVNLKLKAAEKVKINVEHIRLREESSFTQISRVIKSLNQSTDINGIMVQLPLQTKYPVQNLDNLLNLITANKDVDGLGMNATFIPASCLAIHHCISHALGADFTGSATIIGKGRTVGKPCATYLMKKGFCVTSICSQNPIKEISSDVLISAAGKPQFLKCDQILYTKLVIDVGCSWSDKLCRWVGDVDDGSFADRQIWISPVPGGVGPITVAMLMKNTIESAELAINIEHTETP
ncbi:hypothetical protein GJ496_007725 [Pomphorhynchus laevis]|nr:hypothetical protein GJ496_007725 [Pomphorhynchus laevis]